MEKSLLFVAALIIFATTLGVQAHTIDTASNAAGYSLTGPSGTLAVGNIAQNGFWFADPSPFVFGQISSWLGVAGTDAAFQSNPGGYYTFATIVNITQAQFNAGPVSITGFIAADNSATFNLNNNPVLGQGATGYDTLTAFTLSNLAAGPNILEVIVYNEPSSDVNPMGLLISGSIVNTVPIPAAAWLFGSAVLGLGVIKRKKA